MLATKMTNEEIAFVDPEDEIDLRHYASKYYDPVKAKAYYERTKELKGRKSAGSELSSETRQRQAEASTYVRDQISTEQTATQKVASEKQTARLEKLRADAEASRDRIVEKLNSLVAKLKADVETEVPPLKLNQIPPTASPRQRAFLEKQNARLTSEHNGKLRKAQKKASDASSKAKVAAREEITKVGTNLKTAVTKARTEYSAASKALSEKYKSDLATELQNIEEQVR